LKIAAQAGTRVKYDSGKRIASIFVEHYYFQNKVDARLLTKDIFASQGDFKRLWAKKNKKLGLNKIRDC
jgi:hypothetical protein